MLITFAHIQRDDSLVPLLPYATGCFLASVLLTISGIAETHPQALFLATCLIQIGWLLLHVQGVMLVQKFGTPVQSAVLFHVWLVSMQLLDVHRRFLKTFAAVSNSDFGGTTGNFSQCSGPGDRQTLAQALAQPGHAQGNTTSMTVRAYYMKMLCSALPAVCERSQLSARMGGVGSGCKAFPLGSESAAAAGATGMQEMERLVLFEIAAGLGVSLVMIMVWLAMTLRQQGGDGPAGVRKVSARWQRVSKTVRGLGHDLRVLVAAKVEGVVDGLKFRIE
ncbi:hypothetical protein EDD21DRAFT_69225 [Dissophora ornata]|nr:hypothetical protein EDD21DRAFT_69225 [Dissophora ornata]